MQKTTKTCDLRVHLIEGTCVRGQYHVDSATSSAIRPSDAIRQDDTGWILLTHVQNEAGDPTDRAPVVMINRDAISIVEIMPNNWRA